jgi:hypothetical protein
LENALRKVVESPAAAAYIHMWIAARNFSTT